MTVRADGAHASHLARPGKPGWPVLVPWSGTGITVLAAGPPGTPTGQQSLTESITCTFGMGGGQLIETALAVLVPAAACAQAAAGAAARVTAAAASTALPASLASGREAGRRSPPR